VAEAIVDTVKPDSIEGEATFRKGTEIRRNTVIPAGMGLESTGIGTYFLKIAYILEEPLIIKVLFYVSDGKVSLCFIFIKLHIFITFIVFYNGQKGEGRNRGIRTRTWEARRCRSVALGPVRKVGG